MQTLGNEDWGNTDATMRVLVADQEPEMLEAIARVFEVDVATSKATCIDLLRANHFDVLVACERLADGSGLELLSHVGQRWPNVIRILAIEPARRALLKGRLGPFKLFETLSYPIDEQKLEAALERAAERIAANEAAEAGNAPPTTGERPSPSSPPTARPANSSQGTTPAATSARATPVGTASRAAPVSTTPSAAANGSASRAAPIGATPRAAPVGTASRAAPISTTPRVAPVGTTPHAATVGTAPRAAPVGVVGREVSRSPIPGRANGAANPPNGAARSIDPTRLPNSPARSINPPGSNQAPSKGDARQPAARPAVPAAPMPRNVPPSSPTGVSAPRGASFVGKQKPETGYPPLPSKGSKIVPLGSPAAGDYKILPHNYDQLMPGTLRTAREDQKKPTLPEKAASMAAGALSAVSKYIKPQGPEREPDEPPKKRR